MVGRTDEQMWQRLDRWTKAWIMECSFSLCGVMSAFSYVSYWAEKQLKTYQHCLVTQALPPDLICTRQAHSPPVTLGCGAPVWRVLSLLP